MQRHRSLEKLKLQIQEWSLKRKETSQRQTLKTVKWTDLNQVNQERVGCEANWKIKEHQRAGKKRIGFGQEIERQGSLAFKNGVNYWGLQAKGERLAGIESRAV